MTCDNLLSQALQYGLFLDTMYPKIKILRDAIYTAVHGEKFDI